MPPTFWAHSDPSCPPGTPNSTWQKLGDHLIAVSNLSRELARAAAPNDTCFQDLAAHVGLLHDLGKYSGCFQQMILGNKREKCPHAIYGAALATQSPIGSYQMAYAIAGHHAGLHDRTDLRKNVLANLAAAHEYLKRATADCLPIRALFSGEPLKLENISSRADLYTRMLFSCLVDADRLDTARRPNEQLGLDASRRLQTLLTYIAALGGGSETVRQARKEVLAHCLDASGQPDRLLSISVPTGGGKTLATMALALKRAALDRNYRRIIVVIPYLSIIEQNAAVYRSVFGDDAILEHHSGNFERLIPQDVEHFSHESVDESGYQPPSRLPETENWDAPCIVTTSVRFFESLFSNRPSNLRRVHNIARSIVILDEVQVLPRRLLSPLLTMIRELSRDWGCAFVLSTATKPAFERPIEPDPALIANSQDNRWDPGTVREVIPEPQSLHTRLKRVRIKWQLQSKATWQDVALWMKQESACLCIVNTREHASKLYTILRGTVESGILFHLSTRMCAAHRLEVIARLRRRLSDKLPTVLVSTQLIEAGVDLDFPAVFRAIGPLDSIIQAGGRADREGKLTEQEGRPAGRLTVFIPEDESMPPGGYKEASAITKSLAAQHPNIQTDDLEMLTRYFERYYRDADTGAELLDMRARSEFKTLALNFEMIQSITRDVFVPYREGKVLIDQLHAQGFLDKSLRRLLQPYAVGLMPYEFRDAARYLNQLRDQEIWTVSETSYHSETGLQLDVLNPLIL